MDDKPFSEKIQVNMTLAISAISLATSLITLIYLIRSSFLVSLEFFIFVFCWLVPIIIAISSFIYFYLAKKPSTLHGISPSPKYKRLHKLAPWIIIICSILLIGSTILIFALSIINQSENQAIQITIESVSPESASSATTATLISQGVTLEEIDFEKFSSLHEINEPFSLVKEPLPVLIIISPNQNGNVKIESTVYAQILEYYPESTTINYLSEITNEILSGIGSGGIPPVYPVSFNFFDSSPPKQPIRADINPGNLSREYLEKYLPSFLIDDIQQEKEWPSVITVDEDIAFSVMAFFNHPGKYHIQFGVKEIGGQFIWSEDTVKVDVADKHQRWYSWPNVKEDIFLFYTCQWSRSRSQYDCSQVCGFNNNKDDIECP